MGRKVLFVHDGPIHYEKSSREYYGIHYKNELVERYTLLGETVTFLTRKEKIELSETERFSKIDHSAFKFKSIPNFKSVTSWFKKREAKGVIKDTVNSHDVIIVRLPSAIGAVAFEEAIKQGIPVLVEMVACVFDALWNYNWQGKLLAHFKYLQYRSLMKKATHTVYVTNEFLQSRYPTLNGKSIGCSDVIIPNSSKNVLERRVSEQKKEKQSFTLATVAAVNVLYKGQADVIRAIAELKKQDLNFHYKIIGQGDPSRLKDLSKKLNVSDRVEVVGPLPHDKIFTYLQNVDVYVQSSQVEGLPRAVIEAMSIGCPVIGTNAGGIPELISDRMVYKKGDIDGLVSKLKCLSNDILRTESRRNFEKAQQYSFKSLEQKRSEFYDSFLKDYDLQ